MRRKRFLGFLPAFCLVALPLVVRGESTMQLGDVSGEFGGQVTVPLTLTTDDVIQGLVAVFDIEGCAAGVDIQPAGLLLPPVDGPNADTVVLRPEAGFMVLGVVMDSNPNDNDTIPEVLGPAPDEAILLANVILECCADPGDGSSLQTALTFVDGVHAAREGGPALDNIVVVDGLSQASGEGLTLVNGSVTCTPMPDSIEIEDVTADPSTGADVRVLMTNVRGDVEGFQVAVCYDAAAIAFVPPDPVEDLLGADAEQADFIAFETEGGVAIGIVIDLIDPMQFPPNIPVGVDNHVLTLPFACISGDCPSASTDPDLVTPLSLCDGVVGEPVKENLIVVGGLSYGAGEGVVLQDGAITWRKKPVIPPDIFIVDVIDPETGEPVVDEPFEGTAGGGSVEVGLTILTPLGSVLTGGGAKSARKDGVILDPDKRVSIQGLSLAYSYECDELAVEETFDITGTILQAVGAEFIGIHADNSADDGDDCSMVLAILLDATPPFEGQVIPPLPVPQKLGTLSVRILDSVGCNEVVTMTPDDGVDGRGEVPVFNLISVENQAYPVTVRAINFKVTSLPPGPGEGGFFRGDCNFSRRDRLVDPVEVADAAAVVSYLFGKGIFKFDPPCLDACDANDDARINIADALAILYFLFVPGTPLLPDPYPGFNAAMERIGPGPDPTEDNLNCEAGELILCPVDD
ncbi:MAG: hypothetical protein JXA90_12625 [Planctomycetes bacterium]|nr:hypothetical protein [Planctomycetota bacterium]